MKIGLVLPGFSADERDWCIPALLNFVRCMATEHEVHVWALEYPYRRAVYSVYGATVHSLGGRNRGQAYAPRLWIDAVSAISSEHRRAPFDLLHAFWLNKPGAIALLAGRILKVPVIVSAAGGELVGISSIGYGGQLHRVERAMVGLAMRGAGRVTVGSRYLQRAAARWRPDVVLLPLGVDTDRFAPGGTREGKDSFTVLNVGSLVRVKQQRRLLDGFARLGEPAARLEIIGNGDWAKLRDQARSLGIASRVSFLGQVSHETLTNYYRRADLVVQSSLHEAQGMAVLEAAACGIALAGTPVGILPELAERAGAVVSSGFGSEGLVAAMARALGARERLGESARRAVEQCFSIEVTWNGWRELYHQVARR